MILRPQTLQVMKMQNTLIGVIVGSNSLGRSPSQFSHPSPFLRVLHKTKLVYAKAILSFLILLIILDLGDHQQSIKVFEEDHGGNIQPRLGIHF
jgi:hypothetical protein